jgi:hypothetical protein
LGERLEGVQQLGVSAVLGGSCCCRHRRPWEDGFSPDNQRGQPSRSVQPSRRECDCSRERNPREAHLLVVASRCLSRHERVRGGLTQNPYTSTVLPSGVSTSPRHRVIGGSRLRLSLPSWGRSGCWP